MINDTLYILTKRANICERLWIMVMCFSKNMGKNISKDISKDLSSKYSQKLFSENSRSSR